MASSLPLQTAGPLALDSLPSWTLPASPGRLGQANCRSGSPLCSDPVAANREAGAANLVLDASSEWLGVQLTNYSLEPPHGSERSPALLASASICRKRGQASLVCRHMLSRKSLLHNMLHS